MRIQSEINIGLVGHVDHGKTTLTRAMSGIWADTHSEEKKRGITIKLGYADAVFRKCMQCDTYTTDEKCPDCGGETEALRKISFVDAPGHETLMATMLSGAAIMDGALLVISANEECPQLQTKEHLMALQIIGVKKIVIVQNKIDVVDRGKVIENYNQIKAFTKGTVAEDAPIIPISAQHNINIDQVIKAIEETIPTPVRDEKKPPKMLVARSFDVNKPGITPQKLVGGIFGGALQQGKLSVGEEAEILPGSEGKPLKSFIVSLFASNTNVSEIYPGGLVGVGTQLDSFLTKADNLSGSVLGHPGELPPVMNRLTLEINLLERAIGTKEELKVEEIRRKELLMVNVGTAKTVGEVAKPGRIAELELKLPVCAEANDRVAISRRIGARWRLIGYGVIVD
jgi:translation initiation factor 2 subunit 3